MSHPAGYDAIQGLKDTLEHFDMENRDTNRWYARTGLRVTVSYQNHEWTIAVRRSRKSPEKLFRYLPATHRDLPEELYAELSDSIADYQRKVTK